MHVHFEPLYVCIKTLDIIQRLYQTKICTFKEEHLGLYTNDKKVIKTHSLFAILLKLNDFEMVRVMHLLIRNVISYTELSNAFMDSVIPYA